jgi:hypothetical protein
MKEERKEVRRMCTCRVRSSAVRSVQAQVRMRVKVKVRVRITVSTVTYRASISPLLVGSVTQLMTFNGGEKQAGNFNVLLSIR